MAGLPPTSNVQPAGNSSAIRKPSVFHHTEVAYLQGRLQDIDGFTSRLLIEGLVSLELLQMVIGQNRERGASHATLCLLIHLCQSEDASLREKFDAILERTQPDVFQGLKELVLKRKDEEEREQEHHSGLGMEAHPVDDNSSAKTGGAKLETEITGEVVNIGGGIITSR